MDFEFIYDYQTKQHSVVTSSEQRAVGVFLSNQLQGDPEVLETLLGSLEQDSARLLFTEWVLEVEGVDIHLQHNSLLNADTEHGEESCSGFMDWEMSAKCGKDDLIELVSNWLSFIVEQKG